MKSTPVMVVAFALLLMTTASCGSEDQAEERRLPTMVSRDVTPDAAVSTPRPSQLDPEEDKGTRGATPVPTRTLDPTATPIPKPTPTPEPTSTPMPTAAPEPTPAPTPEPGTVLFEADFSEDLDDWSGTTGWFELDGILLQDGSAEGSTLVPPFDFSELRDYAIEVEVRTVQYGGNFGFLMRAAGDSWISLNTRVVRYDSIISTMSEGDVSRFAQGAYLNQESTLDWRTFRAEVDAQNVRLLMDGNVLVQGRDNSMIRPGYGGFWVDERQMEMRAFRIIAL